MGQTQSRTHLRRPMGQTRSRTHPRRPMGTASAPLGSDPVVASFTADGQRKIAEDYVNGKITREVFDQYAKNNALNFNFISPLQEQNVTGGDLAADPRAVQMLERPQIPIPAALRPFFEYDGNPADHDWTRVGMGGACFSPSARVHGAVMNGWVNWPFQDRWMPPSSENQADPVIGSTGPVEERALTPDAAIQPPRGSIAHRGFFEALPPGNAKFAPLPEGEQNPFRLNAALMDPLPLASGPLSPSTPQRTNFRPTSQPFLPAPAPATGKREHLFDAPRRPVFVDQSGWAM